MRVGRWARIHAPAKVNLFLRVLGRRPDGFHDLVTLFQAVDLHDTLTVSVNPADPGGPGVTLDVDGADLGPPEENLAHRAAQAVLEESGAPVWVHVRLKKRIPAGGGLGGGSSDAAAVLRVLDRLLDHPLPPGALLALAAGLGSDVPFFLGRTPLALGRGRGELLEPLEPLPPTSLVVVLPPVHVATGGAYAALARARAEAGASRDEGEVRLVPRSWEGVAAAAVNDFERVVPAAHPEVEASLVALRRAGAAPAMLSGSGATCFGVFPSTAEARAAAQVLSQGLGWPAVVARTLDRWPEPEVGEGVPG